MIHITLDCTFTEVEPSSKVSDTCEKNQAPGLEYVNSTSYKKSIYYCSVSETKKKETKANWYGCK